MPKYYDFKICGYYLYFTAHCIVECMYVHASDARLTEGGSAKFFVKSDGDAVLLAKGRYLPALENGVNLPRNLFIDFHPALYENQIRAQAHGLYRRHG